MSDKLTASEAVFGLLAWLSTREETLEIGAKHNCAILSELANEFCDINALQQPRENWTDNFKMPL